MNSRADLIDACWIFFKSVYQVAIKLLKLKRFFCVMPSILLLLFLLPLPSLSISISISISTIQQFIYKYYVYPVIYDQPYNIVNTITYAILLALAIVGILRLLHYFKIEVNESFIFSVSPYILAGSSLRVIEDAEIVQPPLKYFLITPLIYIVVFTFCITSLYTSMLLERSKLINNSNRLFAFAGWLWSFINLGILLSTQPLLRPWVFFAVFGVGLGLSALVFLAAKLLHLGFLTSNVNLAIITAHLCDAASTYIGMDYLGYIEQHVVPTLLINLAGTALIMLPLKLLIFIPILYAVDKYMEDSKSFANLMKLAMLVIGLAPGIRNTLRMMLAI
jgi:uncharacterized membrane protein